MDLFLRPINQATLDYNRTVQHKFFHLYQPHYAWRKSIDWIENAVILPQTIRDRTSRLYPNPSSRQIYNSGVYRPEGHIVSSSVHVGHSDLVNIPDLDPSKTILPFHELSGKWLYGGVLKVDFGHTLTEGLGRLWGIKALNQELDGIVFTLFNGIPGAIGQDCFSEETILKQCDRALSSWPHLIELFRIFCPNLKIKLVGLPLRVDELVVPSQLMGLAHGSLIGGHATYRDAINLSVKHAISECQPIETPIKLYISRASMSIKSGRFFAEDAIEELLTREGYQVLYPEKVTIKDQLRLYSAATHIILGTGSAAHMLALGVNKSHQIALLHREPGAWGGFATQLRLMGAGFVHEIDCIVGSYVPMASSGSDSFNIHPARAIQELDISRLWLDLQSKGFVHKGLNSLDEFGIEDRRQQTLTSLSEAYNRIQFCFQGRPPV